MQGPPFMRRGSRAAAKARSPAAGVAGARWWPRRATQRRRPACGYCHDTCKDFPYKSLQNPTFARSNKTELQRTRPYSERFNRRVIKYHALPAFRNGHKIRSHSVHTHRRYCHTNPYKRMTDGATSGRAPKTSPPSRLRTTARCKTSPTIAPSRKHN